MPRMIMTLFFLLFVVVGVVAIAKYRASLLDDLGSSNGSTSREALLAELGVHNSVDNTAAAGLIAHDQRS